MAVSTKHVNNQIENKLNRLSVCWLHAAAFWVWWMCWGFFSVVIRVPYSREVRIFKLETYEVEDMPTIVRGTAGMRERSVLSELSGLENIKKICSLCYRLRLQVDTDLPLTCMTWNNSKMIQNLSASICVRIDSFSEKVWKVIRFICVINCLHKLLYLINWKTLWVAGLTVHCLAQWSFPAFVGWMHCWSVQWKEEQEGWLHWWMIDPVTPPAVLRVKEKNNKSRNRTRKALLPYWFVHEKGYNINL